MILKDKMFLVAGNIDDSIKSQTSVYDITLFKTFVDFEKYVDVNPVIIETLVITTNELQFTNTNMTRLLNILNSPFMEIKGSVVYLVDYTYKVNIINDLLSNRGIMNWAIYQGDLSPSFISNIISGEGRDTIEGQIDLVTYRIRASEYIKQQQALKYKSDEEKYFTDEDLLGDIPNEEEPEDVKPSITTDMVVDYIVGFDNLERTLMSFILAQYRALQGKTIIVEKDAQYHLLTEMVTKSGIDCEFVMIDSLFYDITQTLNLIRETFKKLIVIGCKKKMTYDYNFLLDILQSNLKENVSYLIRECSFEETPYGKSYTIVIPNTVPEVLKCCNFLKYDIVPKEVTFIGMQLGNLGPMLITREEMQAVISQVLEKNNIIAEVVKADGILLKGDEITYDILSIVNRGN